MNPVQVWVQILTWVTCPTRVTSITWRAGTRCCMQSCCANGIGTAALDPAGVYAGASVTLLIDPAIIMDHTLGPSFNCWEGEACICFNEKTVLVNICHFDYYLLYYLILLCLQFS